MITPYSFLHIFSRKTLVRQLCKNRISALTESKHATEKLFSKCYRILCIKIFLMYGPVPSENIPRSSYRRMTSDRRTKNGFSGRKSERKRIASPRESARFMSLQQP